MLKTDMQAMNNPTCMKVIEFETKRLAEKAKSLCSGCCIPGFCVVETVKGLPYEMHDLLRRPTLKYVYRCQKCNFKTNKEYPFEKRVEDHQYYDFCNL